MARRRRRVGSFKKAQLPGWALLLLGLALGITFVLLAQLVTQRAGSNDGLAGLLTTKTAPAEQPAPKRREPAPIRPKFDFYTVLPEVETVLPDRGAPVKQAKAERADEGVSFVLQAGSFASFGDADQLKAQLALHGLRAEIQKVTIEGRGEFHRVRLGPYDKLESLDAVDQQLSKMGIKTLRLRVKQGAG